MGFHRGNLTCHLGDLGVSARFTAAAAIRGRRSSGVGAAAAIRSRRSSRGVTRRQQARAEGLGLRVGCVPMRFRKFLLLRYHGQSPCGGTCLPSPSSDVPGLAAAAVVPHLKWPGEGSPFCPPPSGGGGWYQKTNLFAPPPSGGPVLESSYKAFLVGNTQAVKMALYFKKHAEFGVLQAIGLKATIISLGGGTQVRCETGTAPESFP